MLWYGLPLYIRMCCFNVIILSNKGPLLNHPMDLVSYPIQEFWYEFYYLQSQQTMCSTCVNDLSVIFIKDYRFHIHGSMKTIFMFFLIKKCRARNSNITLCMIIQQLQHQQECKRGICAIDVTFPGIRLSSLPHKVKKAVYAFQIRQSTLFCCGKFQKKLADAECSSITMLTLKYGVNYSNSYTELTLARLYSIITRTSTFVSEEEIICRST